MVMTCIETDCPIHSAPKSLSFPPVKPLHNAFPFLFAPHNNLLKWAKQLEHKQLLKKKKKKSKLLEEIFIKIWELKGKDPGTLNIDEDWWAPYLKKDSAFL